MIDLHTHTTNSDGDLETLELIKKAEENEIEILSISDHNNITSYEDLKKINIEDYFSGTIIVGTELEFAKDGRLFDMLGYGFDLNLMKETEIIKKGMIHTTIEKETKILNNLKDICDKLEIKYSSNLSITSSHSMANDVLLDNILTFEENKEKLNKMGIKDRSTFYRKHFCEPQSPFYINNTKGKFDVFYVTQVIHNAGGKAFLAHPFVYKLPNLEEFLNELVSLGIIDGIECQHRKHTEEQIRWIENYCDKHGLLKSGGSDFHTEKHKIGHANNNTKIIEKNIVENWINEITPFYKSTKV